MKKFNSTIAPGACEQITLLMDAEIYLFRADLVLPQEKLDELWSFLDEAEKQKALRFKFEYHRRRYIASKGRLREILSQYVNTPPAAIRFHYGPHGKPYLNNLSQDHLFFNMSNSQDLAVYAITFNREIGVDVEYMRDDVEYEDLAKRFFSTYESKTLMELPPALRKLAFFKGWTSKEAFIKAIGEGLSFHLSRFDVNLHPNEPAALLAIRGDANVAKQWRLHAFEPLQNYAAALAIKSSP